MARLTRALGLFALAFAIAVIITIPLGAPPAVSGGFGSSAGPKGTFHVELVFAEHTVVSESTPPTLAIVLTDILDKYASPDPLVQADWNTVLEDLRKAALAGGLHTYAPITLLARGDTQVRINARGIAQAYAGLEDEYAQHHRSDYQVELTVSEAKDDDFVQLGLVIKKDHPQGAEEILYTTNAIVQSEGGYIFGEPLTILAEGRAASRLVAFKITRMPES